ncbi:MAG: hypothetical protein KIT18_15795 [Burkholderiales bacterium]|nr:hypothetical protein [Burkholderiales bacterium]
MKNLFRKCLREAIFVLMLAGVAGIAGAQMTGELGNDLGEVQGALGTAISATGIPDAEASRVAMEELYRRWRIFRKRHFDAHPEDPRFVPDMENVEARLFAASQFVDGARFSDARAELDRARALLIVVRKRHKL